MYDEQDSTQEQVSAPLETPEDNELAKKWAGNIESARKHWKKFHKRVKYNRKLVAGFDWEKEPDSPDFYKLRANLIHGTITALMPTVYARNPEISATPLYKADQLKLFCKTLETVTNRALEMAGLKHKAKMTVRSALTSSFGVMKVLYQRDYTEDPVIRSRINDTQDNIARIEALMQAIDDPDQRCTQEATIQELQQTMAALEKQVEVVAAEGLVVDRVLTDQLLIDPSVTEFWDYKDAGWMAQVIPMQRGEVQARYKVKIEGAKVYKADGELDDSRSFGDAKDTKAAPEDDMVAVIEIWDKRSQSVYTMVDGCKFWVREPYSPENAGARWYPFFLLPFQLVDGQFVAPSLVDLTEKLQTEHNEARDRLVKHRDLAIPGWVAGSDVGDKGLQNFVKSVSVENFGTVAIVDTQGKPISQVIQPKTYPPIDMQVYDTAPVRYDWEQVSGMQDAARSTVVQPKTATEASIMQQSLSGRVSEFRDQVEDVLQDIAQYAAQILLFELTPGQVERIMGPHEMTQQLDPLTGQMVEMVTAPSYEWPQLSREDAFDMVQMRIRAGTTGSPDKLEQQESWAKLLPTVQGLVQGIMQIQGMGGDASPLEALLRETVSRFDDKLDVEQFIPKAATMPPALAGGAPAAPAAQAIQQLAAQAAQPQAV